MALVTAYLRAHRVESGDAAAERGVRPVAISIIVEHCRLESMYIWPSHEMDLSRASLKSADLSEVHLQQAVLSDAHLEGAYLSGAHLEGAYLWGALLEGVDLSGAHLGSAATDDLVGLATKGRDGFPDIVAKWNDKTQWPEGFDPQAVVDAQLAAWD